MIFRNVGRLGFNSIRAQGLRDSLIGSGVVVLTALSLKNYFFFLPFENGFGFLSWMAALTLFGWIALVTVPPVILFLEWFNPRWTWIRAASLMATATIWTLSTVIIKIYGLAVSGEFWVGYLFDTPIMVFVEWILPGYYIYVALQLFKKGERLSTEKGLASNQP